MASSRSLSPIIPWRAPRREPRPSSSSSGSKVSVSKSKSESIVPPLVLNGLVGRIKNGLKNVETSISGYDTAWVAMVPSADSDKKTPQFPQCVDWILMNQQPDGSWGSHDNLSSTLACVIALKKWNIGEEIREKGIKFIMSNWSEIGNEKQCLPIGFDVLFPGMIKLAMMMGLYLPLSQWELDKVLSRRELELKRASQSTSKGAEAYLALVSEGLDRFPEWEKLIKYQRKNGSILYSPSTTAAALSHHQNDRCFEYLDALVHKYKNGVPFHYSSDTSIQILIIDILEGLGVAHHFTDEIDGILNEAHRLWLQNDEEITSSPTMSAAVFRLLRMNGYAISYDSLDWINEGYIQNTIDGFREDCRTVLELHKASQFRFPGEISLKDMGIWTKDLLSKEISRHGKSERLKEVEYALQVPSFASLQRLEHRRNIGQFEVDSCQIFRMYGGLRHDFGEEIKAFAIEEFNGSQCLYRRELEYLARWVKENRMDQLKLPRQKLTYCFFSAAATLFVPEMANARISWAQNGVLTTLVDDFFDIAGSREELINLIHLVDQWEEIDEVDCCSDQVKIIYSALHSTINEIGAKASTNQGYDVTIYIINIWRDLLRSFMREAEWVAEKAVPTMEQYMDNGYVSFAIGPIIFPVLYLIGPRVLPDVVGGPECSKLYRLVSTCGRLLNDIQSFDRENEEGKVNSLSLLILERGGTISIEGAKEELRGLVEREREELLELVAREEESVVPRACKDLFWNMSRILHLFYSSGDGFSSPIEMLGAVSSVLHDPI